MLHKMAEFYGEAANQLRQRWVDMLKVNPMSPEQIREFWEIGFAEIRMRERQTECFPIEEECRNF